MIVCFTKIDKIALDPSLAPAPYLSHFEYVFSDLKLDECITRALQKLLCIPEAKMYRSKILSLKS